MQAVVSLALGCHQGSIPADHLFKRWDMERSPQALPFGAVKAGFPFSPDDDDCVSYVSNSSQSLQLGKHGSDRLRGEFRRLGVPATRKNPDGAQSSKTRDQDGSARCGIDRVAERDLPS
jgi:hypothetical protein